MLKTGAVFFQVLAPEDVIDILDQDFDLFTNEVRVKLRGVYLDIVNAEFFNLIAGMVVQFAQQQVDGPEQFFQG